MEPTWDLLRARFDAALDLAADERDRFLRALAGEDPALAARVGELLAAMEASEDRLEPPAVPRSTLDEPIAASGTRVGGYRLGARIATGGMGVVYEAEQQSPRRRVALKMLRVGFDSPDAIRRFRDEAEVLARLRHPGIAQVHEAGIHRADDGTERPWFAMEFVEGATDIVGYCTRERLDADRRLALFADVCDVIQHGHQRGIVHRDVKPANVLVDATGRVKVIDFGVARTLDADGQRASIARTREMLVGTLRYMSPEQFGADADAVDTRTDVYSLGVLLYEMLTGRPPYDVDGRSLIEAARIVCEQPPVRPGHHGIHGDVEWILLTALAKEPAARYSTVAELGEDVRRHLRREPITARPPSLGYQLRTLARRHRALVAGAALAGVALLVAAVVTSTFWLESVAARERATARADEAEEVTRFVVEFLRQGNPAFARGERVDPLAFLDAAAAALDNEIAERPAVRARLAATIGEGLLWLDDTEGGDALLEKAIQWREPTAADDAEVLYWRLVRANVSFRQGDIGRAERACRDVLARLRPDHQPFLEARATAALGSVVAQRGDAAEAERLLRRSVVLARVPGVPPLEAASCLESLGVFLRDQRRPDEAEPVLRDALAMWDHRYPAGHARTLELRRALALCARDRGELGRAAELVESALADADRLVGAEHVRTAALLSDRANLALRDGRTEQALDDLTRALEIERRRRGPDHRRVGWVAHDLATVLVERGREAEAGALLDEAERIYRASNPDGHAHFATVLATQADLAILRGDADRAARYAEEADAMRARFAPDDRLAEGGLAITRAEIALRRQDAGAAEAAARRAIDVLRDYPDSRWRLGTAHVLLARILNLRGAHADAEREARTGLARFGDAAPNRRAGYGFLNLGWALAQQGRHDEARDAHRESLRVLRLALPAGHADLAWPLDHLGLELLDGSPAEAVALLSEAVEIRREHLGPADPAVLGTMLSLARAHGRAGDFDAGDAVLALARQLVVDRFGADHRYATVVSRQMDALAAARAEAGR